MKTNWQTKKLGEVCEIANGGTPKTNIKKYWGGDILWITPKDMGRLKTVYVSDTERKISNEGVKNSSAKKIPLNSIILSSRAPIGYLAINRKEITTNQGCKGIIPKKETDVKFLFYFLKHSGDLLQRLGSGTTFKELSSTKLSEIEIPLPPLPEQHRIVKILDEFFEKMAKAKENAEKNLQNAKELFESYLNNIFSNPRKNWEERKLKEVCDKLFAGGDVPKKNLSKIKTEKYNIPIFANGFKDKGLYGYTDITKVTEPSITISARGTIGYAEIRKETFFPVVRLIVLTPDVKIIDLFFLYYMAHDFKFSNTGTSIPQLTIPMIENIKIPVPSMKDQKSIVKKLDALSDETKKLEAIYKQKLADLEELKKSVLKKAFSGEL